MKTVLFLAAFALSGGLCWWALAGRTGNRSQAAVKLNSDNIHVFDSVAALKKRYPFMGQEFVGSSLNRLPWQPKNSGGIYAPQKLGPSGDEDSNFRKPAGFEYFTRIKFVPVKPSVAVDYARLNELNKVRESHGQRAFNPGAIDSVHLYTVQMEIQTGMEAQEAKPDVWAYNKAAEEWKGLFVEIAERGTLRFAPDPTDPHRFDFNGTTFQFNTDFTQITSTGKMKSTLTRADKLPHLDDMAGYQRATLKMAATSAASPEFLFRDYSHNAMIVKSVPIYFKPDGKGVVGKALINGQTYLLNGFKDANGTLKLFTTMKLYDAVKDDAFLQWNPGRAVVSVLPYSATGVVHYITYQTAAMEKGDLKGKDAEMAANYDSLGSVPETIQAVPQVWNYYDATPQPVITAADAAKDPGLCQIFNLTPARAAQSASSSPLAPAMPSELPRAASPLLPGPAPNRITRVPAKATPRISERIDRQAKVSIPNAVKQPESKHAPTDQELEQQMQEAYRKRRRGY